MKAIPDRPMQRLAMALAVAAACASGGVALAHEPGSARESTLRHAGFESAEAAGERTRAPDHTGFDHEGALHRDARVERTAGTGDAAPQRAMSPEARDAYREGQLWTAFALNPTLGEYGLDVDVRGDRAILTGVVETPTERRLAADIASRLRGIQQVDNRVRVEAGAMARTLRTRGERPGFADMVADSTTAALIDSKLLWNRYTHDNVDDIKVRVQDGVATLSGVTDTDHARRVAERLARDTSGVVAVHNRIVTDLPEGQVAIASAPPHPDTLGDSWIEAKIASMLRWSSGVNADAIDVRAEQGVVRLTGQVDNDFARQLAIELAQDVRGVRRVDASRLEARTGDALTQR